MVAVVDVAALAAVATLDAGQQEQEQTFFKDLRVLPLDTGLDFTPTSLTIQLFSAERTVLDFTGSSRIVLHYPVLNWTRQY